MPEGAGERGDAFLGLIKTCAKLSTPFRDYLGDRLKVPDAPAVPCLAAIVTQSTLPT
jgi:hypothetical protein